jgi:hypothetical protein
MPKARQKVRPKCRYWLAVPLDEAEVTSRCPDCSGFGTRPVRKVA